MAEYPALPIWTDALLGDTTHLSAAEFGAYVRLLCQAWRRPNCDLPNDPVRLARMAGASEAEWAEIGPVVMGFWDLDKRSKTLRQKRLTKTRLDVSKTRSRQRNAAASRWKKAKKPDATAHATDMPKRCNQNQNHIPPKSPVNGGPSSDHFRGSILEVRRQWVTSGNTLLAQKVTAAEARDLLARKMVSEEQLRAASVQW